MITAIDVIKHMKYRTRRSIAINFVLLSIGLICGYYMKEILHSFKTALVHNNTNKSKLGFFESIEREEASSNSDGNGNTILGTNRRITTETDEKRTELFKVLKNYETTMRSCLGFYCFDDPVQLEGNVKIVRIGILSPYDKNSKLVEDMMKIINNNSNKIGSDSNNKVHSIEFVRDTHVPAYGYGKNHGWSRIIRIVGILPEEATQILANAGISSSNDNYQQLYASQVSHSLKQIEK